MDKRFLALAAALSLLFVIASVSAQAQPILPDKFYGSVKLGGVDAAAGTQIDVYLAGSYLKSYQMESAGNYTIYVSEGVYGDPVSFLIGGVPVGSSVRTGGLRQNLNLSLSATGSSSQALSSQNRTMSFIGKDTVSADIDITTNADVTGEGIAVSLYEDGVLAGFYIGDNQSHVKSVTISMNGSIVDYAILKVYYTAGEIGNFNEASLRIYFYNESSGNWELVLQQGINTQERYVWANVTHFSTYGLFGEGLFCGDGICSPSEGCSSCSQDCGSCPAPSGGGTSSGGGGGGGATCTPLWECSEWSGCMNGTEARACTDADRCGTNVSRPAESRSCGEESAPQVCTTGVRVCADNQVMECAGDSWKAVQVCPERCYQGACAGYENQSGQPGGSATGFFLFDTALGFYGLLILVLIVIGIGALWIWKRPGK